MKQTPPVLMQARRLEAHLAIRAGAHARAMECFDEARRLASECGLAFESAVVALERGEHTAATDGPMDMVALVDARAIFEQLGAAQWLARAEQLGVRAGEIS
jgi:hypothetical protein